MLKFRKAAPSDLDLYFNWANDPLVREQSFNSDAITLEEHSIWFMAAIANSNLQMLVFSNEANEPVGQVRLQKKNNSEAVIGVSISPEHRGKGYASRMLEMAADCFLKEHKDCTIHAYIKQTNIGSVKSFEKAGFVLDSAIDFQSHPSFLYTKRFSESS